MPFVDEFKKQLFQINESNFEACSLAVFDYQFNQCQLYNQYCNSLGKNPKNVKSVHQIPYLPIEFFKNHAIKSGKWETQKIFKSSGTTQAGRSQHHVADLAFYHEVSKTIFEEMFGPLYNLNVFALLPSYLEQGDSSLISMVDHFINLSGHASAYILDQNPQWPSPDNRCVVFGVTYALLDWSLNADLSNTVIIETGGMKGRRKEITRSELHQELQKKLTPEAIWSEYGMTELMSQAYGKNGDLIFPNWAKVLIREVNDPFCYLEEGRTGGINVIDLANVHTCSFIETKDLGVVRNDHFEVVGRFDNSEIRGCNLLV
ncbi:MAG: acyltransferase [Ekhidna sp.]